MHRDDNGTDDETRGEESRQTGDDVACSGRTTAEMNFDSRGYVNIQAAEVRSEMSVDSGGDSEDERRQRRLRFMQRRLLH